MPETTKLVHVTAKFKSNTEYRPSQTLQFFFKEEFWIGPSTEEFISVFLLFLLLFFCTYSLRCDEWKFRHSANKKDVYLSLWENLRFIPCTINICLFKKHPSLLKIIFVIIWDWAWKFTSVVALLYLTDSFIFYLSGLWV